MSNSPPKTDSSPRSERRIRRRQPVLFSCAEFGVNNGGTILNISESGMALQTIAELVGHDLPKLRFQFSRSRPWMEANCRITWISDSKRTAGVEFIDLPEDARKQIRTWITLTNDAIQFDKVTFPLGKMEENAATKTSEDTIPIGPLPEFHRMSESPADCSRGVSPTPIQPVVGSGSGIFRSAFCVVGFCFAAVILLAALILLGRRLQRNANSQRVGQAKAELKLFESAPATVAGYPIDLQIPAGVPAVVFQVGAMIHPENANALVDKLRRKNFPSFVFNRGGDRFYYVMVGPYESTVLRLRAKKDLEKQGFQAIRAKWEASAVGAIEIAARERVR